MMGAIAGFLLVIGLPIAIHFYLRHFDEKADLPER